jgi:hypothetical protein
MSRNSDQLQFAKLFKEAYKKHFSRDLREPLTEAESKIFCNNIEEKTGLVVGFKSVKNYSLYLTKGAAGRQENPSLATLDTLARYVLNAPHTSEQDRKRDEGHYPYWHLYQKDHQMPDKGFAKVLVVVIIVFIAAGSLILLLTTRTRAVIFEDNFDDVATQALNENSWEIINKTQPYWDKRDSVKGFLRMYTLEGDNWPDTVVTDRSIKNLLVRPLETNCFDVEVSFRDFVPRERWQQAGLILLEDTTLTSTALRLSIAFNDFFGGFAQPSEIIVQGITLQGETRPEEMLHYRILGLGTVSNDLVLNNLRHTGLRIEMRGTKFRFLLANGNAENMAYKEIGKHEFTINPVYIGIFALKGNVQQSSVIPADINNFKFQSYSCGE